MTERENRGWGGGISECFGKFSYCKCIFVCIDIQKQLVFNRYFGCRVHVCCSFSCGVIPGLLVVINIIFLYANYILTRSWEKLEWEWKSISWKACFFTIPICMVAVGTVLTHVFALLVKIGETFGGSQGFFFHACGAKCSPMHYWNYDACSSRN